MVNHFDYLEETGTTASKWEKFVNIVAEELVDVLSKSGCTYYDAKLALNKANSILECSMLKAKV